MVIMYIPMRKLLKFWLGFVERETFPTLSVMGVRVGVENLFLDQSIGIDDTNTFQLKFLI